MLLDECQRQYLDALCTSVVAAYLSSGLVQRSVASFSVGPGIRKVMRGVQESFTTDFRGRGSDYDGKEWGIVCQGIWDFLAWTGKNIFGANGQVQRGWEIRG